MDSLDEAIALGYRPEATGPHSPLPWKIKRHPTPYATWLMDASGGCVCLGFKRTDESLLLAAPLLLAALQDVRGRICLMSGQASSTAPHNAALDVIDAAIAAAKGGIV